MPLYEFECTSCKRVTESIEKMDVSGIVCPVCESLACKVISSPSFHLKDGGWASEGYSKKPSIARDGIKGFTH
jgi:putative FmdB family regulatory protein